MSKNPKLKLCDEDFLVLQRTRQIVLGCARHFACPITSVEHQQQPWQGNYLSYCAESRLLSVIIREMDSNQEWSKQPIAIKQMLHDISYFISGLINNKKQKNKILNYLLSAWDKNKENDEDFSSGIV